MRSIAPALAVLLLSPLPAWAGPVTDAAAALEAAVAAGDYDAFAEADAALDEAAWTAPGLHFGRLVLTEGQSAGYGGFTPRADGPYSSDQPIHVYAEPKGYGYGERRAAGDRLRYRPCRL